MKTSFRSAGLAFVLFLCSQSAIAQKMHDVVFDLNGTLAYQAPYVIAPSAKNIVTVDRGYRLEISDYTVEVIRALHERGNFRISILSNGSAQEITGFANAIEEKIPGFHFFKAMPNSSLSFFNAGKDLRALDPAIAENLQNAVLIDDSLRNLVTTQRENFMWLSQAAPIKLSFRQWGVPAKNPRFGLSEPLSENESRIRWFAERNKLVWALGALLKAEQLSQTGFSFVQAVQQVINDAQGNSIARSATSQVQLVIEGFKALGIDPETWSEEKVPQHEFIPPKFPERPTFAFSNFDPNQELPLSQIAPAPIADCEEVLAGNPNWLQRWKARLWL